MPKTKKGDEEASLGGSDDPSTDESKQGEVKSSGKRKRPGDSDSESSVDDEDADDTSSASRPPPLPPLQGRKPSFESLGGGEEGGTGHITAGSSTRDFSQPLEVLLESLPTSDRQKFIAADVRRKEDDKQIIAAHAHLVKVRSEFHRVQTALDKVRIFSYVSEVPPLFILDVTPGRWFEDTFC